MKSLLLSAVCSAALCSAAGVLAADSPAPAAAPPSSQPTPEELEPRVNTSAPSTDAPQPQKDARSSPAAAPSSDAIRRSGTSPRGGATPNTGASPSTGGGAAGKAHDRIELEATQITGNRELPKVLYIVPWKRSDLGDLTGKPVNSLIDDVLQPVDRDVFKRQNRYYQAVQPDRTVPAGAKP